MNRRRAGVAVVVVSMGNALFAAKARAADDSQGPTLTLAEVIRRTVERDPKGLAAQARFDETEAVRLSALGGFGPRFQVDGTLFWWNEPHDMVAVDPSRLDLSTVPPSLSQGLAPLLTQLAQPIRFRDERTMQLQVTAIQPLTQLYLVEHGQKAAHEAQTAAEHQRRQSQREATYRATEAYYRVLAAQHLGRVADEAVATLTAHLEQAKAFRDADMLGLDEYLAVEVERGNAVENQIKAKVQRQLANAALATLMGQREDRAFALVDIAENAEPPALPSLDEARKGGLDHRPEIAAIQAMARASSEQVKMAWWQLTPQVSGLGRYQRSSGSAMNNTNEWFVGGVLSWNLWDWGATYYKARAAEAQVRQARAKVGDARDLVDLEIQQRYLSISAARERLNAARTTLRQAEEAFRISRMKFEQHTISSTAVLDSQTRWSRAQASRIQAQYELILAVAALRLSMGEGVLPTVLVDELVTVAVP